MNIKETDKLFLRYHQLSTDSLLLSKEISGACKKGNFQTASELGDVRTPLDKEIEEIISSLDQIIEKVENTYNDQYINLSFFEKEYKHSKAIDKATFADWMSSLKDKKCKYLKREIEKHLKASNFTEANRFRGELHKM